MTKSITKRLIVTKLDILQLNKIDECEIISSVNPLYLRVSNVSVYIKEKNGNKYLIFDSVDENKKLFKKQADVWTGI